jgi:hypothetical protein
MDPRKAKLKKGLNQLNESQLKRILESNNMVTDTHLYHDSVY